MSKILDIQKSIQAVNGNVALAQELFTMLLNELESIHPLIENSFQSGNLNELEQYAHKLFGSTVYCVAPGIRKCSEELELALKLKHHASLGKLVSNMQDEIKSFLSEGATFTEKDWLEYQ